MGPEEGLQLEPRETEKRNKQRAVTLNCLARAGCDKDLEAIGTAKHERGKTGQLFVSVRPFSVLDEATRAVTFEGVGISRTGTVQKGLGDRRLSDRPMLKCSLSDSASNSFLYQSVGSCVTACSTLTLPLPCCRFLSSEPAEGQSSSD